MSSSKQLTGAAKAKAEAKAAREAEAAQAQAPAKAPDETPKATHSVQDPVLTLARSIADTIPAANAAQHAEIAESHAKHSGDPQQSRLEATLATLLRAKAAEHEAAEAARARNPRGSVPTHVPNTVAAPASALPKSLRLLSGVMYHTNPQVPDSVALITRLWPADESGNRYQADLFILPNLEGGQGHVVSGVTYGVGQGQFSELPEDIDEWGLAPGRTFDDVRSWKHE